jgi:hypothetical protein
MEQITHNNEMLAMIVRANYSEPGISFFTNSDLSQQLAFMKHDAGKLITPHVHNSLPREVAFTQEVLFIRKGCLRVDFYSQEKVYLFSRVLFAGDVVLLAKGGHGFEVLEDLEMFEVKQGPYAGDKDKTRFDAVSSEKITIKVLDDSCK